MLCSLAQRRPVHKAVALMLSSIMLFLCMQTVYLCFMQTRLSRSVLDILHFEMLANWVAFDVIVARLQSM